MHRLADRLQDGQVDDLAGALRQIGRIGLAPLRPHEGAAADLAGDQAAADQLLIGAAHRLNRDAHLVGEAPVGLQPGAAGQKTVMDGPRELVGKREIGRAADERRVWTPQCHDFIRGPNQFN